MCGSTIISKMTKPLITLGIAGGTGAGKTTLAKAIYNELGGSTNVVYLTHDNYYKDIRHKTIDERSKTNFDHPNSLDTTLLIQNIKDLKLGNIINVPNYDFTIHGRTEITTTYQPKPIVIVEGILVLSDKELLKELDMKVFVDAASDTRVVRRIARDTTERGRTLESILKQYQTYVKPMHDEFVEPSKVKADVIINSDTGHDIDIAIHMLSNHLRVKGGLLKL